jgi:hypothetical protein
LFGIRRNRPGFKKPVLSTRCAFLFFGRLQSGHRVAGQYPS